MQQDGQYFNLSNIAFLSALSAIKPTSGEKVVQILWNVILATWFPPTEPYKIAIKAAVLTDSTQPDRVVFEIRNLVSGDPRSSSDLQEKQIFMLEFKRISNDTQRNGRPRHTANSFRIFKRTSITLANGYTVRSPLERRPNFGNGTRMLLPN
ncbi:hypothetical protein K505DRAFT_413657 [Melanomma pulvis-pyrius CBS 109.77]|uniref:Uncharacterized protein n=1 Tax=Melanomma pulvis-pyrius CBS 109.77 TaxID=1314802 RepID=A0A6A6XS78_9PLEO|nr:hypothetical protein K505DRAFT_413657 [Melanomma pulvis-pyrius CBS 109.77]